MPKNMLQKLFYKPEYQALIVHVPLELQGQFPEKMQRPELPANGTYSFILDFAIKQDSLKAALPALNVALLPNGLLWIAYPKNKALGTDLNRDVLHETAQSYGLEGVSLVSLNDTWSAMRFKKIGSYAGAGKVATG